MQPLRYVDNAGVRLAVYQWGDAQSTQPLIVLVHGYPDNAMVWTEVAEKLAHNFRVIAYDVRGAGRSSRPTRVRDYALPHLVADLRCVIDAVSPDQPVHLAAHDWGSIQSWEAVCESTLQHRIASYTSMSGPSLDHAGHWIRRRLKSTSLADKRTVLKQLLHSWYIFAFQLPVLGPGLWSQFGQRGWPVFLKQFEGIAAGRDNPTQVLDGQYGVKLYRANMLPRVLLPRQRRTSIPVQVIFPRNDHFMIEEIWQDLRQWTAKLWRIDIDAGHWLVLSQPEQVARRISEFVSHIEGAAPSQDLRHAQAA